ncbi:MAG: TadE/TadG family type IV pilus assembly protein [Candidatus Dormibacteria bacterium]
MVEFALVLPVALLLVALAATGGQMLVADINITQAARAGATAAEYQYNNGNTIGGSAPATLPCSAGNPPSPEVCWATTAAEQELGSPLQCTAGGSVPTGCLTVSQFPDPTYNSGEELVQVAVWDSITPYLPLFPRVTIKAVATAEQ